MLSPLNGSTWFCFSPGSRSAAVLQKETATERGMQTGRGTASSLPCITFTSCRRKQPGIWGFGERPGSGSRL